MQLPTDTELETALQSWLPGRRWFSSKNRTVDAVHVVMRQSLADVEGFAAEHVIVSIDIGDEVSPTYQIPIGYRLHPAEHLLSHSLPPQGGDVTAYDGLQDPEVAAVYADALTAGGTVGSLRFASRGLPAGGLGDARLLDAEQSNSSIVVGEQVLIKFFRRIEVGENPDVELHRALGDVGCEFVAPLRGWLETDLDGGQTTLAMAQVFVENAADGWSMAQTSIRDLFAEADMHAAELGTDFAGEATRLGNAVAGVHEALARALGTSGGPLDEAVIDAMRARLAGAARMVPELGRFTAAVEQIFSRASGSRTATQRIHGDLHLGQTLRTPERWLLIDFEGEPVKDIADRMRPASPLRDVAGMLRSFDYAGHHLLGAATLTGSGQREFRAGEWVRRNSDAFCDGYAEIAGTDPRAQAQLLRAYELDKAVYEVVYEARNRPDWLPIPLRAIERLVEM